ncbi:MAG: type II toxin-antitoxin system VapC family toxin [Chloroflexi bacterium]|nr:type II toxin-antitoxin system VapC family toxin [Chloroflexota bacterium]
MPEPVFIDANVVMYAVGPEHPNRAGSVDFLREASAYPGSSHSSAEVLQELLHVYLRRQEPAAAANAISALVEILRDRIVSLTTADVIRAASLTAVPGLQVRDRIHFAVMERLGISRIVSTDRAFDSLRGITRLDPADFATWKQTVFPGAS